MQALGGAYTALSKLSLMQASSMPPAMVIAVAIGLTLAPSHKGLEGDLL